MKHLKQFITLLMVLVMMLSMTVVGHAASTSFSDVSVTDWFYKPVAWAVEKNITSGIGNGLFGPYSTCTRGQVVTFLWKTQGCPSPSDNENPFSDVTIYDYYYEAVLWAVEKGITGGIGNGMFGSANGCTRGQVVTFLWATAGKPEPKSLSNPFSDVSSYDYFYKPVLWAVENGITGGVGDGLFGPHQPCTRGQIVTFLNKAMGDDIPVAPDIPPRPQRPVISAQDRIEIAAAYVTDINSVDGVDIAIYWRNNTGRTINYIHFNCYVTDLNGAILKNDFYPYYYELDCWLKGPITPENVDQSNDNPCTSDYYYTGVRSSTGNPTFSVPMYDKEYKAEYYYDTTNGYDFSQKIYINPANRHHNYMGTHWEAIIYNGRAAGVTVRSVDIEYADGGRETINNPVVGPRTNPADDRIYTKQFLNNLSCDVTGHSANPTCTESDTCTKCGQVIEALGHDWSYSGYCSQCRTTYVPDVTLVKRNFPDTEYANDRNGNEYSFRVKNVYFDPKEDLDVSVPSSGIEVSGWVYCTFAFESASSSFYPDSRTFYVDFVDENGKVVHTETIYAGKGDTSEWFNVDFPGNGTYYVDIRYKDTVKPCATHTWGDDLVCTVCKTRRVPENDLANPLDYIEVGSATVTDIDDNDGVNTVVYWRNNTGKTITRIDFYKSILDKYGNALTCDINNNTTERCYMEADVSPDNVADGFECCYYWNGEYVSYVDYDEKIGADTYWWFPDEGAGKQYAIHPDNKSHTYMSVYWSDIMRNPDAVDVRIDKIEIQFADGTTATYYEPKEGFRNNLDKDKAYTAELEASLGCAAFGHSYSTNNVCDRCGEAYVAAVPQLDGELPAAVVESTDNGSYRFTITDFSVDESVEPTWEINYGYISTKVTMKLEYSFENISGTTEGEKRTVWIGFADSNGDVQTNAFVHVDPAQSSAVVEVDFPSECGNSFTYGIDSEPYDPSYWEE